MNKRVDDFVILPRGDKLEDPEDELLEEKKNADNLKNLHDMLKLERVLISSARSKGIYEKEGNRVRITKAAGRWSGFGYTEDGNVFLNPHEALLFMEMVSCSVVECNYLVIIAFNAEPFRSYIRWYSNVYRARLCNFS